MAEVSEATRENFDELVARGTTLFDVWGPDCRPCLALKPHVEQLATARDDLSGVLFEASKARRVRIRLKVHALPTALYMPDREVVSRLSASRIRPTHLLHWL